MGRGGGILDQRRPPRALARTDSISLGPTGRLHYSDEGQPFEIDEQGLVLEREGYRLWISESYSADQAEAYAAELDTMIAAAPPKLRNALELVGVLGAVAPPSPNGSERVACASYPGVVLFWALPSQGMRPSLRREIFEHELAHLVSGSGQPPIELRGRWSEARRADRQSWDDIFQGELRIGRFAGIAVALGGEWLRPHRNASERTLVAEDWATAVSLYLHDQREPAGDRASFSDCFPARAAAVADFFG